MKKFHSVKTDRVIARYILKVFLSSVISVLLFGFLFSVVAYKFDLSMENGEVFSIFICAAAAFCIAFISVSGMKNNGVLLGIISEVPLVFYSLINLIFNDNHLVMFVIKAVIALLIGALTGFLRVKKGSKIKVK